MPTVLNIQQLLTVHRCSVERIATEFKHQKQTNKLVSLPVILSLYTGVGTNDLIYLYLSECFLVSLIQSVFIKRKSFKLE